MEERLTIDSLDESGFGCAKIQQNERERSVRVFGALPQEEVQTSELYRTKKDRKALFTTAEEVIKPSPSRVSPRCEHVGHCGGCLLQHMAYREQRVWKEERVRALFSPYANVSTTWSSCLGPSSLWFYRNKMEFSFSQDASHNQFLGLYSLFCGKRVETIRNCHIGPIWSSDALEVIRAWWKHTSCQAYHPYQDSGSLRHVAFRSSERTKDAMVILTVSGRPEWALKKEQLASFVEAFLPLEQKYERPFSILLRIQQAIKKQPTQWFEMVLRGNSVWHERYCVPGFLDMDLQFSPGSFSQPNSEMANLIYGHALHLLDLQKEDCLWDLFCGVGGFGLAASKTVRKVVGIELSYDAVFDANCNTQQLQAGNVTIEQGDVFQIVSSPHAMDRLGAPTKVVVDPPRAGLGARVVDLLSLLHPQAIMYVSCNIESQVKDVQLLAEKGWKVQAIQPIDQFPHTPHIENLLLLKR